MGNGLWLAERVGRWARVESVDDFLDEPWSN